MRPVALVLVGGSVLLAWLVLITASVWYFYEHWEARLSLRNQRVLLRLPAGMPALAEISSPLRSHISMQPRLQVPIRQTVSASLDDHLQAHVQLHTTLPVDTSVTVDQQVRVATTVSLDVPLHAWLPKLHVSVPVTLLIPVHMVVPIKTTVPVGLDLQVSGNLPGKLAIPIDATFDLRPKIEGDIQAQVLTQTAFKLVSPIEPFALSIEQANLRVPFNLTLLQQRQP